MPDPALRALVFDVDGTLAETEELHRRSFNAAFAAASLPWTWDPALYRTLLQTTGGKERIARFIGAHNATPALDAAAIARLHADKTARYGQAVAAGALTLRPGIARLITQARAAGLRLAIATTTSRPNIDALLAATLGENPFHVIAAGDEVRAKKPAPDIYRLALARLGLDAAETLAIEDTAPGLAAARAAGIPTIVTVSTYSDPPYPGALAVLPDLAATTLAHLAALHGNPFPTEPKRY